MAKVISMMLLALVLVPYYDLHLSLAAGTNAISAESATHEKHFFGGAGRGVRGGRLGGGSAGGRGASGGGGRGGAGEKSPGSDSGGKGAGAGAVPFLAGGAAGAAGGGVAATRNHHGGACVSSPAVGLVALGLSLWALLCQTF